MDLRQLLGMLDGVSGPNSSGEYTAKCPAHQDRTASLSVTQKESGKDGKQRIYLCCHAGCPGAEILGALGITAKDLIVNPDADGSWKKDTRSGSGRSRTAGSGKATGSGAAGAGKSGSGAAGSGRKAGSGETAEDHGLTVRQTKKTGKAGGEAAKDESLRPDWEHPDAVYSYEGEDGKEAFQVVRLHYLDGAPGKTFRQRMRATPEMRQANPSLKVNREGFVNSVPAEIRDTTIYRMTEVLQAIEAGKPVYVVEGEKDVETLRRLGFTATCNPGGAGKWREGYSRRLTGADVIILPDSDTKENGYAGQNHALDVALKVKNYARRVRLVDIKQACPEIPPKGDISDMVALMGDTEAMDALARQVAATRDFDPNAVPFWLTPMEQAQRLYGAVKGYGVAGGCIVQDTGNETRPLCDFVALPRKELTADDGVNTSLYIVIDGWSCNGKKLDKQAIVKAGDLDSMNWVGETWGMDACIMPGSTTKGKLAWAIKKVGQMTAQRVTEYNHTGWRRINGKLAFLYQGGAVGVEGVTVSMDEALKTYRLDGGGGEGFERIPYKDAAATSLRILKVMKPQIATALLGTMFLAPLREFMVKTDISPAFVLFLYGKSGTHKSTAASLALSHFGNFHGKNPPASFGDTGLNIRKKAFLLKDVPILVDDYHPVTSIQERRQMAATAQALSRAFGDGADRGRLNADTSIRTPNPPRSVAVITGEDLPAIGESGLARFFILDIDKGDIPVGSEMTEMQELARKGVLQRSMRGYIQWLAGRADSLPEQLHDLFLGLREHIRTEAGGAHDRAPEAVACILMGYMMMLKYMEDLGTITAQEGARMLQAAERELMDASRAQTKDMESEKPTRIFLDALAELLNSKQAALKDMTAAEPKDPPPTERMIGYMDARNYYLLPNVAFAAVSKLCREQGIEFPVSLKALYKHLRTDGILRGIGKDENPAKMKRIGDKTARVLTIPAELLDGPAAEAIQTEMTVVSSDVLPEEFK